MMAPSTETADILNGYREIATFLRISVRQAKHRVSIGAFPIFRQGRCVSARKSSILNAISQAERELAR